MPFSRFPCMTSLLLVVTACANSVTPPVPATPPPPPPAAPLARLELDVPRTQLTAIGETLQIGVRGYDAAGGALVPSSLSWSTTAASVVEISQSGLATARANGSGTISVRSGNIAAEVALTVQQAVAKVIVTGAPPLLKAIGATHSLTATATDRNDHPVANSAYTWASTADAVVRVDPTGRITTVGAGTAEISATVGGIRGALPIEVLPVRHIPVDPFLATPAAGALWEVPVVLIAYIPSADGINLDVKKSPDFYCLCPLSLDSVEQRVLDYSRRKKMALEQGSRYHGFMNSPAQPSLGYRIVEHIIVYDLLPPGNRSVPAIPGNPRFPDLFKVFADLNLAQLINARGVREIWLSESGFDGNFPSYDPLIHKTGDMRAMFESNMSSPTTGDISNSFRWGDDLPVLNHTYVVYGMNFRRSQAEAIHNVGHQLEAMLSHAAWLQDGSTDLFWKKFVGQNAQGEFITGRAGWTHMPPNTTGNYDYLNPTLVAADIEDWRPDGTGAKKMVNVNTWGGLTYPWPGGGGFGQQAETQWYTYWMQNFPGRGNQIPHGAGWMTNWWAFVGNWDATISSGLGLHGGQPAAVSGAGTAPSTKFRAPFPSPHPVHGLSNRPYTAARPPR